MWVKTYADGKTIHEDRQRGVTWLKTPSKDIVKVHMVNLKDGMEVKSPELQGYAAYWHSRTAFSNQEGRTFEVAERIQGQLANGQWLTF